MLTKPFLVFALLGATFCAGCSSTNGNSIAAGAQNAMPLVRNGGSVSQYISHVVVIIQENRSFENFFAGYPGANAPMTGCVGHGKAPSGVELPQMRPLPGSGSGCPPGDTSVALNAITFNGPDLRHDWDSSMTDWNKGKMDGFYEYGQKNGKYEAYSYVQQSLVQPYWDMAGQYVLADAMFPTEFGGSFTGHLTAVAGNDDLTPTKAEVDFPNGTHDDCDSPPGTKSSYLTPDRVVHRFRGPFPCFTQFDSMANVLDTGGISWKYYATKLVGAGMWEPYEAMKYVRDGPDWNQNIIYPQTKILTDPGNGKLAAVTWVSPSKPDSDHPADHSDQGPSWVASVVNAIGESSYWNTTAIVVIWDDWGGWYDNAAPPKMDYRGLGIRVPCLIISPYAKEGSSGPGYVSHTQYEFGSILKFIEQVYNLPPIGSSSNGYTDQRANSIVDSFDFTQQPRPFVPIASKYKMSRFLREPPSDEPVDTQ
ncbi:MAG: alkaline phosphatase family protein [Candidatus Baltobacteraceae bacterium]